MIGSPLYSIASMHDLEFSVGLYARFQANPKESHVKAIKRILRYLKGTLDLCLWYPRGYNFDLVGYTDVDYERFHVDMKIILGKLRFLGSFLVSWGRKKQNSVTLSTTEAKYVDTSRKKVKSGNVVSHVAAKREQIVKEAMAQGDITADQVTSPPSKLGVFVSTIMVALLEIVAPISSRPHAEDTIVET
ncbi:secreted RxLR effector protein 161-like [Nicotiana tabacum]|uniref:Secreted RxLR effector protein 161-like n=1 Tax=Nicotiana tabacum TaxID=4097 RepID=A0AC58RVE7_TOBAC